MPDASESREISLAIDVCLRIGEVLMGNGAGAADVTATMRAVAYHVGLRNAEIDVTFTSLSMSYQAGPDAPPYAMLRQVNQRDLDYEDLTRVDMVVRELMADRIDVTEARGALMRIASSGHHRPRWMITIAWGVMCGGSALMLGGNPLVILVAALAGVVVDQLQLRMQRRRLPAFYLQVVGGGAATLIALTAAAAFGGVDPSLVVTASIIMLLSGLGFMGAFQDALSSFYVTSAARLLEVTLATAGLIAGVSGGLAVSSMLGMDLGKLVPGRVGLDTLLAGAVGAGISAAAFAVASYSPKRVLAPVAAIAALGMLITQAIQLAGFDRPWAVGVAAGFIGFTSYGVAKLFTVPPLIIVVSGIVPLLPGLSIYRALSLLADSGTETRGVLAMVTAASVALALAAGVILGEYIAQPVGREARRLENRLSGPRLVGPFKPRSKKQGTEEAPRKKPRWLRWIRSGSPAAVESDRDVTK